jgi:hypothetical protein
MPSDPEPGKTTKPADSSSDGGDSDGEEKVGRLDRSDDSQDFVDTSVIDFDPDDGLYSGTAVEGTSEIAGPHLEEDGSVPEPDADEVEQADKKADEDGAGSEHSDPEPDGDPEGSEDDAD